MFKAQKTDDPNENSTSSKIAKKWAALSRRKKVQITIATALSVILVIGLPVFAWFAYQRQIGTVILINAPTTISIGSGNQEPVAMIDLSNINVEEYANPDDPSSLISYGEYVFCVTGKYLSEYDLQIARTTNIDFDYELYRVDSTNYSQVLTPGITTDPGEIPGYEVADYRSEIDGNIYYYPYQTADSDSDKKQGNITPQGKFLNLKDNTGSGDDEHKLGEGSAVDADGKTFHQRNYGDAETDSEGSTTIKEYSDVNVYAEPLYWQVKNIPVMGQLGDVGFVDYYVLKINWKDKKLTNNKETDMIYITARKSIK